VAELIPDVAAHDPGEARSLSRDQGREDRENLMAVNGSPCHARQHHAKDLIVMSGYSRFRPSERLLGGVTYSLMHEAPVPLLITH